MPIHSMLSSLLEPIVSVIGAVPVVGAPVAGILQSVTGTPSPESEVAILGGGQGLLGQLSDIATGALSIPGDILGLTRPGTAVDVTGFSGGNGRFATRTTVETLDVTTGQIVKLKRMPGSPHMMNSEISAAKKVFRATAKLHNRMPRRVVRESQMQQLTKAAVQKAITNTQSGDCCPPAKC